MRIERERCSESEPIILWKGNRLSEQGDFEIATSFGIVRIDLECRSVMRNGCIHLPALLQENPEVVFGVGVIRLDL